MTFEPLLVVGMAFLDSGVDGNMDCYRYEVAVAMLLQLPCLRLRVRLAYFFGMNVSENVCCFGESEVLYGKRRKGQCIHRLWFITIRV